MARVFNQGSSQYISINNSANNTGPLAIPNNHAMAVSIWGNWQTFGTSDATINKGFDGTNTAWELQQTSATQMQFDSFNGSTHGAAAAHGFSANQWNHVYGDYTGSVWHIYFNGVLGASSTDAIGPINNSVAASIGAINTGSIVNFSMATFAHAAVWNTNLTAGEISALAKGVLPLSIRPLSLRGYWPLDGLQSPEPDFSGNGNNGTLPNGSTPAAGPPVMMFTPRWPRNIAAAAGGGIAFRRTLSDLGTRAGSRQRQAA